MSKRLQALLFDCDGVLVDTEKDGHRVAFNQAFEQLGLDTEWSVALYAELLEIAGGKERMRHHFDQLGWPKVANRDAFIQEAHRCKTDAFMALIDSGRMTLRPGVAQLIEAAIDARVPVAICSTSNERAVEGIRDKLIGGNAAKQIKVFAGDMVRTKKPDPAIYLLGAKTLGVDPAACVVIEDSNIGLRAAKAAGARCIVTTSTYTTEEDFSQADIVTSDLVHGNITLDVCRSLAGN